MLFDKLKTERLEFKNRLVMSPMNMKGMGIIGFKQDMAIFINQYLPKESAKELKNILKQI